MMQSVIAVVRADRIGVDDSYRSVSGAMITTSCSDRGPQLADRGLLAEDSKPDLLMEFRWDRGILVPD